MITINDKDSTYIKLSFTDEDEYRTVLEHFSIKLPNAQFMPSVKAGLSDGLVKFLNAKNEMLVGLKGKLIQHLKNSNIEYQDNTELIQSDITLEEFKEFVNKIHLPFKPYAHQLKGAYLSLKDTKGIIKSATGSGKSLIIFIVSCYMRYKNKKTMIIVPSVSLTYQLASDFKEYYNSKIDELENKIKNSKDEIEKVTLQSELKSIIQDRKDIDIDKFLEELHLISSGSDKHTTHQLKISTYQSLSIAQDRVDKEYFDDIDCLLIDETHKASSTSISNILKASNKAQYKIGYTGSLGEDLIDNLLIEGLLGEVKQIISMRELIDLNLAAEAVIKPIYLKYNPDTCKMIKKMKYQEEDKYLRTLLDRNKFIAKLANSYPDKNVMVIYKNIDNADIMLEEMVKLRDSEVLFKTKDYQKQNNLKIYYSKGDTKANNREDFRKFLEESTGNILLGTQSIISTGINIKNLHVLILASIGKKNTLIIQSIGRMVRLHKSKSEAIIWDIVDDATYIVQRSGREYPNYLKNHFIERMDTYFNEEFIVQEPKIINID